MPDEIGTLFHQASTPTMSVDPYAVLAGGRRRRRRRRLVAVAGTAAATLVLGVGAWTALSDSTGDEQTLPAATPSASVSLPEAVAEVSLGVIPQTDRTQPLVAAVAVDEDSGRLGFALRTEDGAALASRSVFVGRTERARFATLVPGVTAAVLPAGVTAAVPVWARGQTPQGSAATAMPDGRVLVVWWTDGSEKDTFYDVIWTEGDEVLSSHAASLLAIDRDDARFFLAPNGGVIGYLAPPGEDEVVGGGKANIIDQGVVESFPAVWADSPSGSGGTYAVFLPKVEDVELVVTGDAEIRDQTVHDFGEEVGLVVLADVDGSRESVTEVRFTDPEMGPTGGPAAAE